ncbi:hypothetical protein LIER_39283 [Lithospermum erythrorhizon]|uniref:CCHC-type domain-containing protein n=1 Tax=Lithospermum erythrorhizon TaxID=34254 RepID=A0AAV3QGF2_LITER
MMIQVEQQRALQGQQLESVENVIMHTRSYQNTTNVGNGMNTRNFQIAKSVYKRREVVDKSHLKCNFCGKTGHVRNGCFRLVGFLNGGLNLEVMEGDTRSHKVLAVGSQEKGLYVLTAKSFSSSTIQQFNFMSSNDDIINRKPAVNGRNKTSAKQHVI